MLVDSHVHLDRYDAQVVTFMLARARDLGVGRVLNVGVDLATSRRAVALADEHEGIVLAAVGVHPKRLREETVGDLEDLLNGAVAIGEVGLEYEEDAAAPERQRAFFAECLDLAARFDLPVALHVVGAHDDALAILGEHTPVRTVVHYFQGDAALAARYLDRGCFISVGKPVMRLPEVGEAVRAVPPDRLLLETDTYPLPGRTTEPRDVALVCRAVADLLGHPEEAVAEQTTTNFERWLGKSTLR